MDYRIGEWAGSTVSLAEREVDLAAYKHAWPERMCSDLTCLRLDSDARATVEYSRAYDGELDAWLADQGCWMLLAAVQVLLLITDPCYPHAGGHGPTLWYKRQKFHPLTAVSTIGKTPFPRNPAKHSTVRVAASWGWHAAQGSIPMDSKVARSQHRNTTEGTVLLPWE